MSIEWLLNQPDNLYYLTICLALLGGALFLPFPEDLVLIGAGILIHSELVDPKIMCVLAYASIILGDVILYYLGFFFGTNLFRKRWFRNRVHPAKIKKAKKHLESNHIIAIFVARHLFYLRSITFLSCGAVKMKFHRYLLADLIAALISCSIMISVGYFASENYNYIRQYLADTQIVILIILVGGGIAWYFRRKSKASEA